MAGISPLDSGPMNPLNQPPESAQRRARRTALRVALLAFSIYLLFWVMAVVGR